MATSMIESIFNHLALPPRVPPRQEGSLDKIEHAITERLAHASRAFRDFTSEKFGREWDSVRTLLKSAKNDRGVISALETVPKLPGSLLYYSTEFWTVLIARRRLLESSMTLNRGGRLNQTTLLTAFRDLEINGILVLHVAEQNAGLLIRHSPDAQGEKVVLFEAFEASPLSEEVLASQNALQWDFPGCAVTIPLTTFNDSSFQHQLAPFLEKASTESIKRFAARANKAGTFAIESRDTVDPALITQLLMTILEANGTRVFPPLLKKRVRDEVCWFDGEKPWRRSPFWLVLRVGIQRHLSVVLGGDLGRVHYKFFMCIVLLHLMNDCLGAIDLELVVFIKTKICRRLVKLEVEKERAPANLRVAYDYLFSIIGPYFGNSTQSTTDTINRTWANFKGTIKRPILTLPRHAAPRHLYLTLPNSGPYLNNVLTEPFGGPSAVKNRTAFKLPQEYQITGGTAKKSVAFSHLYHMLHCAEEDLRLSNGVLSDSGLLSDSATVEQNCLALAEKIEGYLDFSFSAYDSNPEQQSQMILTIMELWMLLDTMATELFTLLKQFHPGFSPDMLDVLQLPRLNDMCRLQKIRDYLQQRLAACAGVRMTVFSDPEKGCFAERYFDESPDSFALQSLLDQIGIEAKEARGRKQKEWENLSGEYESLMKTIAESTCLYYTNEVLQVKFHDDRQCTKCYLQRKANRFRISAHEHPLPSNPVYAKAVVFELACPKAFITYREASWRVLGSLALPIQNEGLGPKILLREYSELKEYMNPRVSTFCLASTTKSFLITHYATVRFPVPIEDVFLTNGLKFGYYDVRLKVWPSRIPQKPSFVQRCQSTIPMDSPFSSLSLSAEFAIDANGPSSYEIIASQTKCPSGLNIHEFLAYQTLCSGKTRRWPQILIELGSSNLNFSTEATTVLISQLVWQTGPAYEDDPLGKLHRILRDNHFCKQLVDQLRLRLDAIASNWQETNCMETLITLLLRLVSLNTSTLEEAIELLEKARSITFKWINLLRGEIQSATDAETSKRCSKYTFWAALLCRRTFTIYLETNRVLDTEALECFIQSSMAVHDNLVSDPTTLAPLLKHAYIRDLKMVCQLRHILKSAVLESPCSLTATITTIWPDIDGGSAKTFARFRFLPDPNHWWVEFVINQTIHTREQVVHFHLLDGALFIMGQPVGKLPAEYRTSVVLKELFGNISLLTHPSPLPGMAHMLAIVMWGHRIHVGFRHGKVVVRAEMRSTILEFVPSEVFRGPTTFDLPSSMVENCVHWLDLNTMIIEVRQKPNIWKSKPSNWLVNLSTRQATRRTVNLVDPNSALFTRVARIFDHFELPYHLTVYQPATRDLSVDLRRLELLFHVNRRNLLESSQLRSEIDPDQDAGTWYGLNSKLVLRELDSSGEPTAHGQRSILVPFGVISYKRNGPHVAVQVNNSGDYGRFAINEILGRLDCPAEPRLLYLKAAFHAYTSFVLPDSLTGRTGTEEALHCLRSGYCQPWTPLTIGPLQSLLPIAALTPRREYYPSDLRTMQKPFWNPHLTVAIQSDALREAVQIILRKSEQLSVFSLEKAASPQLEINGEQYLTTRSHCRRQIYQRPDSSSEGSETAPDVEYIARDRWRDAQGRMNVFECAKLIHDWPSQISTTSDLAGILQAWPNIGGFNGSFDKIMLSDLLDIKLPVEWGSLVNFCRSATAADLFRLMFLFSVMSFRHDADMPTLRTLVAFGVLESLKEISPPKWPSYTHFRQIQVPQIDHLLKIIKPCLVPYGGDERSSFGFSLSLKQRKRFEATELQHELKQETDSKVFVTHLLQQWPCLEPSIEGLDIPDPALDVSRAWEMILPEWQRLFQNLELSQYIAQVQNILNGHHSKNKIESLVTATREQIVLPTRIRGGEFPNLSDNLLSKTVSKPIQSRNADLSSSSSLGLTNGNLLPLRTKPHGIAKTMTAASALSSEIDSLQSIIKGIKDSASGVRQQYGADLMQSTIALHNFQNEQKEGLRPLDHALLSFEIAKARLLVQAQFSKLCKVFEKDDARVPWLKCGGLWPIVTPITLLESLRSITSCMFGKGMKESLILYALSITNLQRLLRTDYARQKGNQQQLEEEQENLGHGNWKPIDRPDWLLLEIDANMLIRPGQVDVALATISPVSKSNSVLQMNMGQGKTSCIMPMAAAVLADSINLLRLVVPKALLLQTAQLLQGRLGGLVGRQLRHVPFSRKTPTKSDTIKAFYDIHKEMQKSSGLILALPEQMLSFMLSGLQRLSDGRINEANSMIKVQNYLNKSCRDILDECDNILALRTQLIYPSGSQKTVDGHPHRWEAAEVLLDRVHGHLFSLQKSYRQSIEVIERPQGGFPVIFFLRRDVEDALIAKLVDDVFRGRTNLLPECSLSNRLAIKHFISQPKVNPKVAQHISEMFPDKPAAKQTIHLLRGLFVHRILLMTLKKRWNVQYGLHPGRDPISVPFMAKGTPSDQAEWGHPDVAILFTCLSFYYDGLSIAQLRQSLEHVLKSDDPSQTYDRFSQQSSLPDSLKDWNAINVDDEAQLKEIWLHIHYNVIAIDYFLNNFVFPRHAKQFQMKLQASGWDIPLFSYTDQSSRTASALTTGFSGTNDWKGMLPLTISQCDLPRLSHTNAEVLSYLLQPRNKHYELAADHCGRHISEVDLLHKITNMNIRVIIDAGAQILEMDNESLAKTWLEIAHQAPAIVYFKKDNKPWVRYRNGHEIPLLASPFADDTGECLVYLDEAHTRGTDLKMPTYARGALTLGLGQTKDHTVQAAMRLRQLGTTQAVTFFAPPEVNQSILDLQGKKSGTVLDSEDVICWLLEQTCIGIEQLQPLYYAQGVDFCRRAQAAVDNSDFLDDHDQRQSYLLALRQIEQHTLEQLYGLGSKAKTIADLATLSPQISHFMKDLNSRRKRFRDTGDAVHSSVLQEVEQEREVAYEVENVRELEKPFHYSPFGFPGIHRDIVNFVKTGRLAAGSGGYEEAFAALGRTQTGRKHGINRDATASRLYVSTEFSRTVNLRNGRNYDNFQRHVNWIIWSPLAETALIVIPEEAEQLLTLLLRDEILPVHLLTYAAPVTRRMLHFNDLNFYSIPSLPFGWKAPSWLRVELGIYAGRLYFEYHEYQHLCDYLGVIESVSGLQQDGDETLSVTAHTDVSVDDSMYSSCEKESSNLPPKTFTKRPLTFLQEWLAVRRKGQDFGHTPMGHVCQGKPLSENHPFFARPANTQKKDVAYVRREAKVQTEDDDDVDDGVCDEEHEAHNGPDEPDAFDDSLLNDEEDSS